MSDTNSSIDKALTNRPPIIIVGGGGHGLVVADAARASGFDVVGVLDDNPDATLTRGSTDAVLRVGGLRETARIADRAWILGVGTLSVRAELISAMTSPQPGGRSGIVVHPTAHVAPTARLGVGVFVGPNAVVHTRAVVGDHAIINSGAIVEHECVVGTNTHIAPGAILGGGVRIGAHTLVGLGSRVLPLLSIGDKCTVGAGAVVVRSVLDGLTVVGVPAKVRA